MSQSCVETVPIDSERLRTRLSVPSVVTWHAALAPSSPAASITSEPGGNRRQAIVLEDRDCELFLFLLGQVVAHLGWKVHSYCLMTNHYHLLVETPGGDISVGMQLLNGQYAQAFNRRHGYEGHLFERRFFSEVVESDWHLLELCRYIVLNPVRAGLCRHPGEWRWSSYRALVGRVGRPRFLTLALLGMFGSDLAKARAAFEEFVLRGLARPP